MDDMMHVTVQPGDGFLSIANRVAPGLTSAKKKEFANVIATTNNMTFTSVIYPGQILHVIPSTIPTV